MNIFDVNSESSFCVSIIGPMFAGKTTANIRILRDCRKKGVNVLGFKPQCDNRYGVESVFHSHDNDVESCEVITGINDILEHPNYNETRVIVIEEAHFYSPDIINVIDTIMHDNKLLVVSGLSGSYSQRSIGSMADIIAQSDSVVQLCATCEYCEEITKAPFTIKHSGDNSQIQVGSKEMYAPVCRKHLQKHLLNTSVWTDTKSESNDESDDSDKATV